MDFKIEYFSLLIIETNRKIYMRDLSHLIEHRREILKQYCAQLYEE
ncbi:unnamed protein product [Paramecium octaurelia]|uniref:Uncharacterized protein n=1 Tax=Paramecium octaurelia TaxID=43137 RepID=A0A8S1RS13_PAROT|nr:unnamed protein product [Paramecium octaurelia]